MPILAHKIEIEPSKAAVAFFSNCAGAARYGYNWALNGWNTQYEAGVKPSAYSLKKDFNAFKADLPWSAEIPAAVFSNATLNLGVAFKNFFKKTGKHPAFKSRHKAKKSFNPWDGGRISLDGGRVRIPNFGWVRLRESLRFVGRIVQGVVSEKAGKWFLTVTVDVENHEKPRASSNAIGLDLGVKALVVDSNGITHEGPKPLKKLLKKLQRLSRRLSRKVKGSANRAKAKLEVARLHARIANIRSDYQHNLTTRIVLENTDIAIEDLNVSGMVRNHCLARSLMDQAFGEFRQILTYKAALYGSVIHVVDRWFPSSKTCSRCKNKKDSLSLSVRTYQCEVCGLEIDRDLNAAINLVKQIPVLDRQLTPTESSPLGSR